MRESKTKQIGSRGNVYRVTQFGAKHGGRVLVRLLKMVGGAAGAAVAGESEFDMRVVGSMIANLAETVTEDDYDYLCNTFEAASEVQMNDNFVSLGEEGIFDLHFAGNYIELGQWLLFAIEVNFGGFLGEGGILQKLQPEKDPPVSGTPATPNKSSSKSPNTSARIGPSGV